MSGRTTRPAAATDGTGKLEIRLPAVPKTVTALRWMARDFAIDRGAEEGLAGDVMLAVSEAVTNAVKHAYPEEGQGEVELRGSVADGRRLQIVVSDEGRGFLPGPSTGLGAGLMLIGECADTLAVDQGGDGVTVRMMFQLR